MACLISMIVKKKNNKNPSVRSQDDGLDTKLYLSFACFVIKYM